MDLALFTIILVNSVIVLRGEENCILSIDSSELRGLKKQTANSVNYCAYLGVPYATKPIRFKASRIKNIAWTGQKNFIREPRKCPQILPTYDVIGVEDCLYMNIYTFLTNGNETQELAPVFLYIHGGSFFDGFLTRDINIFDGFIDQGIIAVTFNYRLNGHAFFPLDLPGIEINLGLKDQQIAMKWIQKYIRNFGGDPNEVTLGGWSAGAASVTYHLYTESSAGLFSKAIALSGSFLNPYAFRINAEQCGRVLCTEFNIDCDSPEAILDFKKIPLRNSTFYMNRGCSDHFIGMYYSLYAPRLENPELKTAFLTKSPLELVGNPPASDVPLMMSYATLEDSCYQNSFLFIPYTTYELPYPDENVTDWLSNFAIDLNVTGTSDQLHELHRTGDMIHGILTFADRYAKVTKSNLYLYRYANESKSSRFLRKQCGLEEPGAFHGDDIKMMFQENNNRSDSYLKETLFNFIANFIKSGDPTPIASETDLENGSEIFLWPPYNESKLIMNIDQDFSIIPFKPSKIFTIWQTIYSCLFENECKQFFKMMSSLGPLEQ